MRKADDEEREREREREKLLEKIKLN